MAAKSPNKIFVIDDDVHVLHNVKRMLERQGYLVGIHDGGPGCSSQALRFEPDLLLVDVKMPFLSGESFVSLFGRQGGRGRPSIALFSAIDEARLEKTARECGADGYISKSDSGLEFARKVAGFLRDQGAVAESRGKGTLP